MAQTELQVLQNCSPKGDLPTVHHQGSSFLISDH